MSTTVASFAQIKLEPYINPQFARTKAARFAPSQTIARGTLVGQITASGLYLPYASGAVDGSQVPVGITVYDIVVDASSNVVVGPSGSTSGILTSSDGTSEIYWRGAFLETELTGLDANAITVMKAREMGVGTVKHVYIP
jgi:Bacteriophage lambda head decoration protein D